MSRIFTVVGARPQFIKAAVVSRALRQGSAIEEQLCHTGQHYDENMSEVFFRELEIPPPAFHLSIGSGPHGQQTGRMLEAIERTLLAARPDAVLVYGDTNSTLAGALAAAKLHIPVVHVEAGLRSLNRAMPEEINRVLTDHVSDLLLAPTAAAVENLAREGLSGERVKLVGDVMFDAAKYFAHLAAQRSTIHERLGIRPGEYLLATIHRAENTDDPRRLAAAVEGLKDIAAELSVVWPVHPRTQKLLSAAGLGDFHVTHAETAGGQRSARPSLIMTEPLGYLDMVALERGARLIVTDSGGVQKEAYFHGVRCVTLREETEWVELVAHGWNRLAPPTDAKAVAQGIRAMLASDPPATTTALYGDGQAGRAIVAILEAWLPG